MGERHHAPCDVERCVAGVDSPEVADALRRLEHLGQHRPSDDVSPCRAAK